mmetsp:Transcript_6781/g.23844  ORF Transcript_6781/g.23844 Transcript_6781/m.23844 type:complete len:147 (-) Transcript_6781:22-462(-)
MDGRSTHRERSSRSSRTSTRDCGQEISAKDLAVRRSMRRCASRGGRGRGRGGTRGGGGRYRHEGIELESCLPGLDRDATSEGREVGLRLSPPPQILSNPRVVMQLQEMLSDPESMRNHLNNPEMLQILQAFNNHNLQYRPDDNEPA